jgi:hypothetical protein
MTMELMLKYQEFPCNYSGILGLHSLSRNLTVTPEDVMTHPEIDWSSNWLTCNPNFTFDKMPRRIVSDMIFICWNSSLSVQDVVENPDLPWNFTSLSDNLFGLQSESRLDMVAQRRIVNRTHAIKNELFAFVFVGRD